MMMTRRVTTLFRLALAVAIIGSHTTVAAAQYERGLTFIVVYRGLLETVTSEPELAGILAHEMGHTIGHHGGKAVTKAAQDQQTPGARGAVSEVRSHAAVLAEVVGLDGAHAHLLDRPDERGERLCPATARAAVEEIVARAPGCGRRRGHGALHGQRRDSPTVYWESSRDPFQPGLPGDVAGSIEHKATVTSTPGEKGALLQSLITTTMRTSQLNTQMAHYFLYTYEWQP